MADPGQPVRLTRTEQQTRARDAVSQALTCLGEGEPLEVEQLLVWAFHDGVLATDLLEAARERR